MSPICPWKSVSACGAQWNRRMGLRWLVAKKQVWLLKLRNFGYLFIKNYKLQIIVQTHFKHVILPLCFKVVNNKFLQLWLQECNHHMRRHLFILKTEGMSIFAIIWPSHQNFLKLPPWNYCHIVEISFTRTNLLSCPQTIPCQYFDMLKDPCVHVKIQNVLIKGHRH
jgi:hypothetical protein